MTRRSTVLSFSLSLSLSLQVPTAWWSEWAATRVRHRGAQYEAAKTRLEEKLTSLLVQRFPQLRVCMYLKNTIRHQHALTRARAATPHQSIGAAQTPLPTIHNCEQELHTDQARLYAYRILRRNRQRKLAETF